MHKHHLTTYLKIKKKIRLTYVTPIAFQYDKNIYIITQMLSRTQSASICSPHDSMFGLSTTN